MEIEALEKMAVQEKLFAKCSQSSVAHDLELHRAIQERAYICAEKDGFKRPPCEYWQMAEEEIHQYFE